MPQRSEVLLHLLGPPQLAVAGAVPFPAKGFALVAWLMLARSARASRQSVAALLWDDVKEEKALGSLRQLLVRVSRAWQSPDPLILSEGGWLAPGPGVRHSDLHAFLNWRKGQDASGSLRGIEDMRGDLLQELDIQGREWSQWLLTERMRLRRSFFDRSADLLTEITRYGRARSADIVRIGQHMLALEPEREETYRTLMEAHGRNGDLAAVRSLHEALAVMLRREYKAEPQPETAALVRRIFATAAGPVRKTENPIESGGARPRVAIFPPTTPHDTPAEPLHRALMQDVGNSLSRYRTFAVFDTHSSFRIADASGESFAPLSADYSVKSLLLPGHEQMTLRLTREPIGEIIWSADYAVTPEKLNLSFRLISFQIAASLAHAIERDTIDAARINHEPSAYRLYLEGQLRLKHCDLPELRQARSAFRRAADIDRNFALPRAYIAQTLQLEWLILGGTDPGLLLAAKGEAEAATAIDPGSGIGHWMVAAVALYQRDFDFSAAKFLEAEALAPNSADFLLGHADALAHLGEAEAGWTRFQRAIDLNPLAPDLYWWSGASIAFKRYDFAGAVELCARMDNEQAALRLLTACHGLLGNRTKARDYAHRLMEAYPGMTAREIVKLSPDRDKSTNDLFYEGLRLAGLS